MQKLILVAQMIASIGIIVFVPNVYIQVIGLFVLWAITFRRLTVYEATLFVITCIFFTGADAVVIEKGVFQFTKPDIWGMPYYEPFVWGFYFLHAMRMLGGKSDSCIFPGLLLATAFSASLSFIPNGPVLLTVAGGIVIAGLAYFRTRQDFIYVFYFVLIGCIIEYVGTTTGTWYYGIEQYYAWWVITWGGSGLVLYRTVMPVTRFITQRIFGITDR